MENQTTAANPSTETAQEALPRWNLSELYSGPDDPRINADLKKAESEANTLTASFRGRLHEPGNLLMALELNEKISYLVRRIVAYSGLMCQINLNNEEFLALRERIDVKSQAIANITRFLDLQIGAMQEKAFRRLMSGDKRLARFTHYLQKVRAEHRYRLSEEEENLASDKDLSGKKVLKALFENEFAEADFPLELPTPRMVTEGEAVHGLRSPDRAIRADAAKGLTKGLETKKKRIGLIFQGILRNCAMEDKHRGYGAPESVRHLRNELKEKTVDAMIEAIVRNYGVVADHFRLKRQLLGLPDFYEWDRYAPLDMKSPSISFVQAKAMVSEVFNEFDPRFGEIALAAWDWLDAEPREGKYGGGFCANVTPKFHPYVLVNFRGKVDNVMTIAHEFGHAAHEVLAGESAGNINDYHAPIAIAEIASIFMESLTFDRFLKNFSKEARLAMLLENIDRMIATVFRQATMHRFEAETHRLLRAQGSITADEAGEIWQRLQQEMHGDSVTFTDSHKLWWLYIPHFFQVPFYVYSYPFGQLLTLALYRRYKETGPAFVPLYKEILSAGGSKSPYDLFAPLGINLDDAAFWQSGLDYIRDLVTESKSLAEELGLLK